METNQGDHLWISEIFDEQEEGIIWYEPLFGQPISLRIIEDLVISYSNRAAARMLNVSQAQLNFKRLGDISALDGNFRDLLFKESVNVWKSDSFSEFNFEDPALDKLFTVRLHKLGKGILQMLQVQTADRKKAAHQLKDRQYRQLLDASVEGVLLLEPVKDSYGKIYDFRLVHSNRKGLELSRFAQADIGKTLSALLPGLSQSDQMVLYKRVYESGEPLHSERAFIDQKGKPFGWFRVSLSRQGDAVVSRFIDITEKKQDEQLIKKQKDLVRSILDASLNGIIVAEAVRDGQGVISDFKYVSVNDVFCRMVHKRPEELEGTCMLSIFPGLMQTGVFDAYRNVVESGQPFRIETLYQSEGVSGWFDISAVKMGDEGLVVTLVDISEQKNYRTILESSEKQLRTIIEAQLSRVMLTTPVFDDAGNIVNFRYKMVNRSAREGLPEHLRDAEGKLVTEIFPDYVSTSRFEWHVKAFITGTPQHYQFHYMTNGMNSWFDALATRIGDDLLIYQHDLTESKLLQFRLEKYVEELKRSNTDLEEFAYVASHDLQEPLRKIHTFSDKLRQELLDNLTDSQQRMFDRMENATQRMRQLIEDLLTYSNISQKKRPFEEISLSEVLSEVQSDLEAAIDEKQASITVDNLPTIRGDRLQLRQLFQNMISNSLKYSQPAKTPEVRITCTLINGVRAREYAVTADPNQSYYLITIRDNGIGFDQNDAKKIFQVFQRLHGRSEYEGTGVGLAIVQKVVNNHHGFITAQSEPAKGATFHILLPHAFC